MEKSGFYWIRFKSPQGHVFEPMVAWRNRNGWRVAGSAEAVPESTIIEILEGPLDPPALPPAPVATDK